MNNQTAVIHASIPPEVSLAILAASADMPSLRKTERNAYAKYNFVSVDDFLAVVPVVAAKHGLFWQPRELKYEIVGNENNHIATTYAFDLGYRTGLWLPEFGRLTVIHPIQGAQTAGSSLAYAEKMFCRFLFKIVTGEEDADSTDNTNVVAMTRKSPVDDFLAPVTARLGVAELSKELAGGVVGGIANGGVKVVEQGGVPVITPSGQSDQWITAAAVFNTFIPECGDNDELTTFWDVNAGVLDKMKNDERQTYNDVKNAFTKRKEELKKGNK